MPRPRLVLENGGCYHCISRIVDRRFIFKRAEKEFFVSTMRKLEAFLDVKVLTYCLMSNHFHLLLEVPAPDAVTSLTPDLLRARLPLLYHGAALATGLEELDRAQASAESRNGSRTWLDSIVARYQDRMGDLSTFLKELKWRFSIWYNAGNDRVGALWEDRFRSVLIEGDEHALMTIAAYIELNPLRARLVGDPKDYRWCGYAEAIAGKIPARQGLVLMHSRTRTGQSLHHGDDDSCDKGEGAITWSELAAAYRVHLFGKGEQRLGDGWTGRGARAGISPATVVEVIEEQQGQLPAHELLLSRVRYFTEGMVIGGADFVENVFQNQRQLFSKRRKTGARPMRGADWGDLTSMRDLRG